MKILASEGDIALVQLEWRFEPLKYKIKYQIDPLANHLPSSKFHSGQHPFFFFSVGKLHNSLYTLMFTNIAKGKITNKKKKGETIGVRTNSDNCSPWYGVLHSSKQQMQALFNWKINIELISVRD